MATETMLVRLKPYNKKKGHVLRRYVYRGLRFQESRGWTRVRKDIADYLGRVHQIPGDEDSPLAFDVHSDAEAKAIDKKEAEDARARTPAEAATEVAEAREEPEPPPAADGRDGGDLSTADLPQNKRKRSKK